jgi:hypothetical protein
MLLQNASVAPMGGGPNYSNGHLVTRCYSDSSVMSLNRLLLECSQARESIHIKWIDLHMERVHADGRGAATGLIP